MSSSAELLPFEPGVVVAVAVVVGFIVGVVVVVVVVASGCVIPPDELSIYNIKMSRTIIYILVLCRVKTRSQSTIT